MCVRLLFLFPLWIGAVSDPDVKFDGFQVSVLKPMGGSTRSDNFAALETSSRYFHGFGTGNEDFFSSHALQPALWNESYPVFWHVLSDSPSLLAFWNFADDVVTSSYSDAPSALRSLVVCWNVVPSSRSCTLLLFIVV